VSQQTVNLPLLELTLGVQLPPLAPYLPTQKSSGILEIAAVEQWLARGAHNPEIRFDSGHATNTKGQYRSGKSLVNGRKTAVERRQLEFPNWGRLDH
jgi:hypothetical protein